MHKRERERGRKRGRPLHKRAQGGGRAPDQVLTHARKWDRGRDRESKTLCKTTLKQLLMGSERNDDLITITQVYRRYNSLVYKLVQLVVPE